MRFGGLTALCDVSLDVEPGTTHAIIGPNGAGKSTCLNVLTGVYRAAAGDGHATATRGSTRCARTGSPGSGSAARSRTSRCRRGDASRRTCCSAATASRAPASSPTGLALPSARRERRRQLARVREVAELLGLDEHLERPVHALSYGDRKRVELARAVCAEPDLLLLDEPVAGMNATESEAMAATIAALRERLGLSIVLVEHDMAFVMGLADQRDGARLRPADRAPARPPRSNTIPRWCAPTSATAPERGGGMTEFLELTLSGLSLGCIYALIAIGFVLVFKATGVVNFAHGSILLLGAYVAARLQADVGFWPALAIGAAVAAVVGGARRHRADRAGCAPAEARHARDPHARRRHRARDRADAPASAPRSCRPGAPWGSEVDAHRRARDPAGARRRRRSWRSC